MGRSAAIGCRPAALSLRYIAFEPSRRNTGHPARMWFRQGFSKFRKTQAARSALPFLEPSPIHVLEPLDCEYGCASPYARILLPRLGLGRQQEIRQHHGALFMCCIERDGEEACIPDRSAIEHISTNRPRQFLASNGETRLG